MIKWPAVWICLGLCFGIWLAFTFDIPLASVLFCVLFGAIIAFIIHFKNYLKNSILFILGVALCSMGFGMALMNENEQKRNQQNALIQPQKEATVVIEFDTKLKSSAFYKKYLGRVLVIQNEDTLNQLNTPILLQHKKTDSFLIDFRNRYFAKGKMAAIGPPSSPGAFDYRKYMRTQKVLYQLNFDTLIPHERQSHYSHQNSYQKLLNSIDSSELNSNSKETIKALTLADRTEMSPETMQQLSASGIMHLFAISGLHIGLLFAFLYGMLSFLFRVKYRNWAIVISTVLICVYGYFIQFPTSVSRAILMLVIFYGFRMFKRPSLSFHSLALTAIILLLFDPLQLFQVGFQLSFVAVFFIFWLYKDFRELLIQWKRGIRELVSVTLSAQLGTLPLVLYYFNTLSIVGFFLNLLIIPFAGVLVVFSFLILLNIVLIPEFTFLMNVYDYMNEGLYFTTQLTSSLQTQWIPKIHLSITEVAALMGIILFLKKVIQKRNYKVFFQLTILICVFLGIRLFNQYKALDTKELVLYNQYNNTVFSIKDGNTLTYYSQKPLDSNFYQYSVEPYRLSLSNSKLEFDSIDFSELKIGKLKVCLLQNDLPKEKDSQRILIIQNSPKLSMDSILSEPHQLIFIDGSNYPDYGETLYQLASKKYPASKVWWAYQQGYYKIPLKE